MACRPKFLDRQLSSTPIWVVLLYQCQNWGNMGSCFWDATDAAIVPIFVCYVLMHLSHQWSMDAKNYYVHILLSAPYLKPTSTFTISSHDLLNPSTLFRSIQHKLNAHTYWSTNGSAPTGVPTASPLTLGHCKGHVDKVLQAHGESLVSQLVAAMNNGQLSK